MKIRPSIDRVKVRQRFINLKEKVQQPQTKRIIFITVIGSGFLFYPLLVARAVEETSQALEATGLDKTPFLNKAGHKLKVGTLAVTGLKVVVDPTAPPMRKAIASAKLVCCGRYAGANVISNLGVFSPQVKIASSACCRVAWLMLSGLEYIDSKS